jgi:hypothetical protein
MTLLVRARVPLGIDGVLEPPPMITTPDDAYALPADWGY